MKILVINSGSSSIKFQVIQMPQGETLCKGLVERLGEENGKIHYQSQKDSVHDTKYFKDHSTGLSAIIEMLIDNEIGVLLDHSEIDAVGHRVVHGGDAFDAPVHIGSDVLRTIKRLSSLAPLHNPANAVGIETAMELFPKAAQIAVFDTAFHQTIPKKAYNYAIPKELTEKHNIRVYGFHGTSHKYVSERAMEHLKGKSNNIISIHLGNGCSITAIKEGKSIEHSLGFGPSNGLIMGTRSGDIDQSVIFFLMDTFGFGSKDINEMLQKKSGLLGLTGYSDLRDIQREANNGNQDCILALRMVAHRIKKYIGSYTALLNGLDAVVFTGGIGENSAILREMVCTDLEILGIVMNQDKNLEIGTEDTIAEFQSAKSAVRLLVIPTNEELEIAKQSCSLLEQ
ncbi:acetate/propionate family kinase [Flagellimonas eckloniae]|uniref:Acetate kinase n=1 Tax=Flagellimonas eckloniae TaxID=346185 RepID=A0A0Q1BVT8_9FLAO|nr:acetate kinase [Allomuricauda eckloniae]KQC28622.1 acetate kinase [Allomuricauda eckloniae]